MLVLSVKVKANASKNDFIVGSDGIIIRIKAPAYEDKANKAICEFLGEIFEVPKSKVTILTGLTAPHKKIQIEVMEAQGQKVLDLWKSRTLL